MSVKNKERVADANRIRTLWTESVRLQPELTEEKRLGLVTREAGKRAPSGHFVYLSSFKASEPSPMWVRRVLEGRMGDGSVLGEPLIKLRGGTSRPRVDFDIKARFEDIERRLDYIESFVGLRPPAEG